MSDALCAVTERIGVYHKNRQDVFCADEQHVTSCYAVTQNSRYNFMHCPVAQVRAANEMSHGKCVPLSRRSRPWLIVLHFLKVAIPLG